MKSRRPLYLTIYHNFQFKATNGPLEIHGLSVQSFSKQFRTKIVSTKTEINIESSVHTTRCPFLCVIEVAGGVQALVIFLVFVDERKLTERQCSGITSGHGHYTCSDGDIEMRKFTECKQFQMYLFAKAWSAIRSRKDESSSTDLAKFITIIGSIWRTRSLH